MRPVSSRFLAAVAESHQLAVQVDVEQSGVFIERLPSVIEGAVTLDATAQVYGRVDLSVVDDGTLGLVPNLASDLLAPYGNDLHVRRGVTYPDGVTEFASLGVFSIETVDVDTTREGTKIALTGLDYSAKVLGARFETAYEIVAGTLVTTAIDNTMVAAGVASTATSQVASTRTTPKLTAEEGGDRLEFVTELARSLGLRMFFDGDGILRFRPIVTAGEPVTQLVEGEGGVLVAAGRSWDRTGAYNRWIVTGENTGEAAPVRGVATDDDPASPTYYFGAFGRRPTFFQSSFLTTDQQAADTALMFKSRELGTTQRVRFGSYVNPALEPGDIARITRATAGIDEDHIIESLTIPLVATDVLGGSTRARQVAT